MCQTLNMISHIENINIHAAVLYNLVKVQQFYLSEVLLFDLMAVSHTSVA